MNLAQLQKIQYPSHNDISPTLQYSTRYNKARRIKREQKCEK